MQHMNKEKQRVWDILKTPYKPKPTLEEELMALLSEEIRKEIDAEVLAKLSGVYGTPSK